MEMTRDYPDIHSIHSPDHNHIARVDYDWEFNMLTIHLQNDIVATYPIIGQPSVLPLILAASLSGFGLALLLAKFGVLS